MNKTLTANIGGSVFNIEENAYHRLDQYIESVRLYFAKEEGTDEIIADIELRMAELFTEKLRDGKQVITLSDTDEVIAVMGEPEEFGTDAEAEGAGPGAAFAKTSRGGKRLFRDPDDQVFFGVCGGISAYFGWDPVILRVIFVTAFLLFGSGLLLYLLLALIIPKARTTAQKLQMRGEPVTAENISKAVSDSFRDLKDDIKDFGKKNDINEERIKKEGRRVGQFLRKLGNFIANLFRLTGIILAKIIGFAVLAVSLIVVFALAAAFLGWDTAFMIDVNELHSRELLQNISHALFASDTHRSVFIWSLAGLTLIPFILLIFAGIQLLFGISKIPGRPGLALGILWFLSLGAMAVSGVKLYGEFAYEADYQEEIPVNTESDILYINVSDDEDVKYRFKTGLGAGSIFFKGFVTIPGIDSTHIIYRGKNKLTVAEAEKNSPFRPEVMRTSNGHSRKNALDNARNIEIEHRISADTLYIRPYFTLKKGQKIRAQEVTYTVHVPVGKRFELSPGAASVLHDVPNINNMYDADMAGHTWIMTRNGPACETCDNSAAAETDQTDKNDRTL